MREFEDEKLRKLNNIFTVTVIVFWLFTLIFILGIGYLFTL